jgi:hypothetical protein
MNDEKKFEKKNVKITDSRKRKIAGIIPYKKKIKVKGKTLQEKYDKKYEIKEQKTDKEIESPKFCPSCGAELEGNACKLCGNVLK